MAFTPPLRHTAVWLTQRLRRCLCPSKGDGSQVVAELAVEQPTKVEFVIKPQARKGAWPRRATDVARTRRRDDRIGRSLLRCMSPFLAPPRHRKIADRLPLAVEERSCSGHRRNDQF